MSVRGAIPLLAVSVLVACGGVPARPAATPVPLSSSQAEDLLFRADDARAAALAGGQAAVRPQDVFAGGSLRALAARAELLRRRGQREERELEVRRLVHLSAGGAELEAVLEVRARERRLIAGEPAGPWARTLRQWEVRIARLEAGWRIVDDHDLPPPRWWGN